MSKNVQIPEELFLKLCKCHLLEDTSPENIRAIQTGLQEKLDALIRHSQYTTYKTGETEQERQTARKRYLDAVGMSESFRWSDEYDERLRNGELPT